MAPQQGPRFCGSLARGKGVTVEQAALCLTGVGARLAEGVYQFPALGVPRCVPPQRHLSLSVDDKWETLAESLRSEPLTKLEMSAVEDEECVMMTINAGSLGGKIPKLIALATLVEPDVACIQETWEGFESADLARLPYLVFTGPLIDSGGLLTLIHTRHAGPRPPSLLREKHFLGVPLQATPRAALSVLNVHLPLQLSVE